MTAWPQEASDVELFRRYSLTELADEDLTMKWLARGFLIDPTYGMIAGEQKTLKTYLSILIILALASGRPVLDHFEVEIPVPVLVYVGEGGKRPWLRRLRRVSDALGLDWRHLPIEVVFDVAPVGSERFTRSIERDIEDVEPAAMVMDPWYAYHGASVDGRNLHQEGALLTSLSAPVVESGASLLVVNHFNQTGTGRGLQRITMAGAAEWSDSWMLMAHRQAPDPAAGEFKLVLDVGSRQWGQTTWELDMSIGAFDPDFGTHDGVQLRAASAGVRRGWVRRRPSRADGHRPADR